MHVCVEDCSDPPCELFCREVMDEYGSEICKLCEVLMQALCGGLGLANENAILEAVGGERKEIYLGINYYPPCPQPELVLGVSPHSDVGALTILLHDQTPGLQIRKGDAWLDVPCIPGALVVNIGDQIEVKSIISPCICFRESFGLGWV